ncbi:hypothetical protein OG762_26535 [Streptomyces sp. NBC_01136]|nr:hypothetical protein OG762_26535 [Streptomyces sp. NBC_01136]
MQHQPDPHHQQPGRRDLRRPEAVVVRPPTRKGRGFDTDRVDIKPNPLD